MRWMRVWSGDLLITFRPTPPFTRSGRVTEALHDIYDSTIFGGKVHQIRVLCKIHQTNALVGQ